MCEHICEPVKWTSLVDARVRDDAAGGMSRCDNSCVGYASDGFCDDGGAGALFGQCALGSDCSDCSPKLYSMSNHRTRHPGCMAAVRGATAKMASHEARLLQAKVTGRFWAQKSYIGP